MTMQLSLAEARRISLAAQGFGGPRTNGRVATGDLSALVDRMGLVQLDSVNVVVRSHYMPFFSRLGPYERPLVEEMAFGERRHFEYWAHVASLIPMRLHPLLRWRMRGAEPRWRMKTLAEEAPGYLDAVLEEVRQKGPLIASDLDDPGSRNGPWWGYNDGKVALEWHFLTGAVTTAKRENFTRYYDLTERVIPADVLAAPDAPKREAQRELLAIAAKCHGVGTAADIADYFRIRGPEARPLIRELVEEGRLVEAEVEGWRETACMHPDSADPGEMHARALLTPFDPAVWERDRTERLFGFHYRIEIYVPEKKRQFGYYVMPFLLEDRLVGRVDLKAERDRGVLLVRGAYVEDGQDAGYVAAELAAELRLMAEWLGLKRVVAGRKGNLIDELRAALRDRK